MNRTEMLKNTDKMKHTQKDLIIGFFQFNLIEDFNKFSEPSAIAYETYIKNNPKVSFSYFNRIFNQLNLEHL